MSDAKAAKPVVLVLWPNRPKAMAELEVAYRLIHLWQADDPETVIENEGVEIQGVVTSGERGLSAAMIDRLPRLEIVACFGVGSNPREVVAHLADFIDAARAAIAKAKGE